ncbi:hypothetical protein EV715DRAFT_213909 [Schizophyllum commune]
MARMWTEAVVEWQRKLGVDLTAPEATWLSSKEALERYVAKVEAESLRGTGMTRWGRFHDTLFPMARILARLCGPIGDTLSSTATVQAHEEYEQITNAFKEINAHLRVVEIVAAQDGRLLYDTSIELLIQVITVLGVIIRMRREQCADLGRVTLRYKEAIVAGTLEMVTNIRFTSNTKDIERWLNFDCGHLFRRMSCLLDARVKGTGVWFFEIMAFQQFRFGLRAVLSIRGEAGCGKSTIVSQRDLDSLLSSFLCQLALSDQGCLNTLVKVRERSKLNGFTRIEKIGTLTGMLDGRLQVFLVVDAIDEAIEEEKASILEVLSLLHSRPNVSILISSRGPLNTQNFRVALLSIDLPYYSTDIQTALDSMFSKGGRLEGITGADTIRRRLILKANGKYVITTLCLLPYTHQ